MKNWKRILAALLALTMLFTMVAFSEEQIAPEAAGEPAPVEELEGAEPVEEPAEEVSTQEEQEPAEELPEGELPEGELPVEELEEEPAEDTEAPEPEEPAEELAEPEEPVEGEADESQPSEELPAEGAEHVDLDAGNKCKKNPAGNWHEWGKDAATGKSNGICIYCNYKCPHSEKSKDKGVVIPTEDSKAVPYNAQYHIYKGDVATITYCSTCKKILSTKITQKGVWARGEHQFYDENENLHETCLECGYDSSGCKHEHRERICDPEENGNVTYTPNPNDKKTHYASGYMWYTDRCLDCGKVFEEGERYFENVLEGHQYNKKGKCVNCKYKTSCEHTNFYIRSFGENETIYYTPLNAEYHEIHTPYCLKICEDCGYSASTKEKSKEKHIFSAENPSVCAVCGYVAQPTSISIVKPAKTELNLGDTLNLSAKIAPDNAVYSLLWFSSDRAVATVSSDGVVTARTAGSTNITVKADNGKASAKLKITVVDPDVPTKLKFSSKKIDRTFGQTEQLKNLLTVAPATAALSWSSSNYEVVYVDDETGEATMEGIGTAKITVSAATVSGKKAKSASITINVTDPSAPTKVTLDQTQITMNDTDSAPVTIKATLEPAAASKWGVDWESSNEDVATVSDDGEVTAVGKGKAKITATATAKNNQGKPVRASVTVEVKNDSYIPEGMSVLPETLNLTTDDDWVDIAATLSPAGEKYGSFTWKNSNEYVVFMSQDADGMAAHLMPQAAGKANITVTSTKNKRVKKTIAVTVTDPHAITSFRLKQTGTQKLFVGEELQLEPVFGGANEESDVSYTSKKNSGIVGIDDETGLITAYKPGKVQVTAKTEKKVGTGKNAKAKSVTLTIRVIDLNSPNKVEIDKNDDQKNFAVGKPVQLSCTITTEKGEKIQTSDEGVKWTVKDPKKALIDDEGKLYALKSGVKITVTVTTDAKGADGQPKKAKITLQS